VTVRAGRATELSRVAGRRLSFTNECDVPMVVLLVAYVQPGVGARVEWSGAGRSIPVGRLTVDHLRDAVRAVLGDPGYREQAGRLPSTLTGRRRSWTLCMRG
jgi:hypothetical protein